MGFRYEYFRDDVVKHYPVTKEQVELFNRAFEDRYLTLKSMEDPDKQLRDDRDAFRQSVQSIIMDSGSLQAIELREIFDLNLNMDDKLDDWFANINF